MINGTVNSVIMSEKPVATPVGPYRSPVAYARITNGAMTKAIFRLRPTWPVENRSQLKGLINANARTVGTSKRNISMVSFHFGPRRTNIMSSAQTAHKKR